MPFGLIVAALAWKSCSSEPAQSEAADRPLPEIRVTLGSPRKTVISHELLFKDQAEFDRSGNYLKPHRLVLNLPDKKRIELISRSTLVRCDGLHHDVGHNDIMTEVYVRHPLRPGQFQEVVADMLTTIRTMGAEPNEHMLRIHALGDVGGRNEINANAVTLSKDGTRVHCTLTPDPEGGWFVLSIFGLGRERRPSTIRHRQSVELYERVVYSSRPILPAAEQIELMFPITDHYFDEFVFKGDESDFLKTFISEAYFGDRYQLTMRADVELDKDDKTITKLRSEPTFVLKELEAVARSPETPFRLRTDPTWRREHRFDLEAWNKLVEAKRDFSAVGIEIDPTPVPGATDYVANKRWHRLRISLLRDVRVRSVESARLILPAAGQIEQVFPATDHFLDNFIFTGEDSDFQKTLVTEAYFDDRYQLTMRADVELDRDDKTITKLRSEPSFVLKELESVAGLPLRADPIWRSEHRFDLEAWSKVYAAKGDFSVLGITIDKTPVPHDEAARYVEQQRLRRDRISLVATPAEPE